MTEGIEVKTWQTQSQLFHSTKSTAFSKKVAQQLSLRSANSAVSQAIGLKRDMEAAEQFIGWKVLLHGGS